MGFIDGIKGLFSTSPRAASVPERLQRPGDIMIERVQSLSGRQVTNAAIDLDARGRVTRIDISHADSFRTINIFSFNQDPARRSTQVDYCLEDSYSPRVLTNVSMDNPMFLPIIMSHLDPLAVDPADFQYLIERDTLLSRSVMMGMHFARYAPESCSADQFFREGDFRTAVGQDQTGNHGIFSGPGWAFMQIEIRQMEDLARGQGLDLGYSTRGRSLPMDERALIGIAEELRASIDRAHIEAVMDTMPVFREIDREELLGMRGMRESRHNLRDMLPTSPWRERK